MRACFSPKHLQFAISIALMGTFAGPVAAETMTFGVVPQQAASRLAKVWIPFLQAVSKEAGINIRFSTTKDIPSFEKCLSRGSFDLAYMNPYHFVVFNDAPGYKAVARQKNKRLKGILVAHKDSNIKRLEDLQGTTIAFPSAAAFGASVLPRAEMKKRGIAFTPRYVKSHDSVYQAVAKKLLTVGGGVKRTFNATNEKQREQLAVFYETKGYTPHAFAAHPKVNDKTRSVVLKAMVKVAKDQPNLLKAISMKGFVGASDADWDDVRDLGLEVDQTQISSGEDVKCRFD
jgi:phosphonate transport system substrate-binding protein